MLDSAEVSVRAVGATSVANALHAEGIVVDHEFVHRHAVLPESFATFVLRKNDKVVKVVAVHKFHLAEGPAKFGRSAAGFIKGALDDNFTPVLRIGGPPMLMRVENAVFGACKLLLEHSVVAAMEDTPENLDLLRDHVNKPASMIVAMAAKQTSKGKQEYLVDKLVAFCKDKVYDKDSMTSVAAAKDAFKARLGDFLPLLADCEPLTAKTLGRAVIFKPCMDAWEDPDLCLPLRAIALTRRYICMHDFGQSALFAMIDVANEFSYVDARYAHKVDDVGLPGELDVFLAGSYDQGEVNVRMDSILGDDHRVLAQANQMAAGDVRKIYAACVSDEPGSPLKRQKTAVLLDDHPADAVLDKIGFFKWFDEHVAAPGTSILAPVPCISREQARCIGDGVVGAYSVHDVLSVLRQIQQAAV